MRTPQDVPQGAVKPRAGRARWWIVGVAVLLIIVLASLRSLATLYTDSLWFSSVHFHPVWSTLVAVKVGLFASFGALFFVVLWVNLVLCDRIGVHGPFAEPEDDLLRRYQRVVRPHAGRVYAAIAFVAALVAAATTIGQWNNWLLFTHATSFPDRDPQFHLNDGFFVFRLPFLEFLVDWTLASLFVILLFTALFHYLNGGIRVRSVPHVRPVVKVHLSVLLALIALAKAGGYFLQRYSLDVSNNGYVEGAGYTDVHARLPALEVLFFVSLFAAAILLVNIRRQGWTLPVLAIGVWAFVALVIGVIYPAVLQVLKVNPAQSTLESSYIGRNISATRAAYGLQHVGVSRDPDKTTVAVTTVDADLTTLTNVRLWDPSTSISLADFRTKQAISEYYTFRTVRVDRYTTHGTIRPAIVGVRQINPTDLPSSSWVATHLNYTHGEGLVLADANQATANGNPVFTVKDVPTTSDKDAPKVRQPAVYFGLQDPGYVIADTRQPELDGLKPTGGNIEGHYRGSGGVRLSSFLTRAAFALRLGDLNVLLSNQITSQSKMMFVRDVRTMAEKAAPFLSFDSQAYPAVVDGQIDWILDAYTTTSNYPYAQNAASLDQDLPTTVTGALPGSFNYIRNSVVVVVNAYSGKMTFYAMDRSDPILRAYESAFPHMFTPSTEMSPDLRAHLRYGDDLFAVQAAIYGRYHITSPAQFYTASDAWVVSPTTGATGKLQVTLKFTHGQVVGGTYTPMTPVYQVMALPGQSTQSFTVTDAYVPAGGGGTTVQLLRALLVANSNPTRFGQLHVYETPPDAGKVGPIQADTEIEQTPTVSREITLLNQQGSSVLLGNILPVPVGQSVIYVRPLYAESKTVPQPQLKYVITVLGQHVRMKQTLAASLNALLGTTLKSTGHFITTTPTATTRTSSPRPPPSSSSGVAQAEKLLAEAASDYSKAQSDLRTGKLGTYQAEVAAAQTATAKAEQLLQGASTGSTSGTSATGSTGSTPAPSTSASPSAAATPASGTSASEAAATLGDSPAGSHSKGKSAKAASGYGGTTRTHGSNTNGPNQKTDATVATPNET